jgi:hypothetical protein
MAIGTDIEAQTDRLNNALKLMLPSVSLVGRQLLLKVSSTAIDDFPGPPPVPALASLP